MSENYHKLEACIILILKNKIAYMKSNFRAILAGEKPVLVDFYADWCGPCKTLAPILKQVKDEMGEALKVVKIDVDKNQALATNFQVRGVPTLILFKDGNPVWRESGVLQKEAIVNIIKQHN